MSMSRHFCRTVSLIVALIALVLPLTASAVVPRAIQIGTEIGPFSPYDNGFLPFNQSGHKNDTCGYRYLLQGGFNYDWVVEPLLMQNSLLQNYLNISLSTLCNTYHQQLLLCPESRTLPGSN
jgi:hypothetical protein